MSSSIAIISASAELVTQLTRVLSASAYQVTLVQPDLIITDDFSVVAAHADLSPARLLIINSPTQREAAIRSGADDYLCLLLLPVELDFKVAKLMRGLELQKTQQATQAQATQAAQLVLLSRLLSETVERSVVLSTVLEHTLDALNATEGGIWLISRTDSEFTFALASYLSQRLTPFRPTVRQKAQGLLGWVVDQGQPLRTAQPTRHPHVDLSVDYTSDGAEYALLAYPLVHNRRKLGVLALYRSVDAPFSKADELLGEGIAYLAAASISNLLTLESLWDYSQQRQVLHEMSRQISASLEIEVILDQTLTWLQRLFDVEFALFWLLDPEQPDQLKLSAQIGVDSAASAVAIIGQGFIGGTVATQQHPVIRNRLTAGDLLEPLLLTLGPYNLIAAPMLYQQQVSGVVALANRSGGFVNSDSTLLATAVEMVVVAVENGRLYQQTLSLMAERERWHKQVLQTERLAVVGRLTASLSHEINNPMQAIRGALALALEDINEPEELEIYLNLCLKESGRVVDLVQRLRQIYRPQGDDPEAVDLLQLLTDVGGIAKKDLQRQKVKLQLALTPLPKMQAVSVQLHLVFVSTLLDLGQMIGAAGGGTLRVTTQVRDDQSIISLTSDNPHVRLTEGSLFPLDLNQSMSRDILSAHGGKIHFERTEGQLRCQISLPLDAKTR